MLVPRARPPICEGSGPAAAVGVLTGERERSRMSLFIVLCSFTMSSSASCIIMGPLRVVTCAPMCPVNTRRTAVFWISTT